MRVERHQLFEGEDEVVLTAYIQEEKRERPAMLVFPGGAYLFLAGHEGEPVALAYAARGFQSFVLSYTIHKPRAASLALRDAAAAVAFVRKHAEEFGVRADSVALCGFSAGGHLAATLAVSWTDEALAASVGASCAEIRPDACVLSYAPLAHVGDETDIGEGQADMLDALFGTKKPTAEQIEGCKPVNRVTEKTAPCFVWNTGEDTLVTPDNTLLFGAALFRQGVPCEAHVFEPGGHGVSLADERVGVTDPKIKEGVSPWFELSVSWLSRRFGR